MEGHREDPSDGSRPAQRDLAAALHEATNALTVVTGWIQRARDACQGRAEAVLALERALRHAQTARNSMRRAIGAKVDESDSEPAIALAEHVAADLAVEAERAEVAIRVTSASDVSGCAVAAPEPVWQVLANLLLNAIAVSPPGTTVAVEVTKADRGVEFAVQDQGPGIDAAVRAHIFDGTHSRRQGGAGIGLRHARALAADHGGRLELANSSAGARFCLRWPLAQRPAPIAASPAAGERSPHLGLDGDRVLLLEDDPAVIELLRLTLEARGARVTAVDSGERLRQVLAIDGFDVLLVDLSPLDGPIDDVVRAARRANQRVDVVIISGSVAVQPRPDVLWIRKPFEPGELVAAIARHRSHGAGADRGQTGA